MILTCKFHLCSTLVRKDIKPIKSLHTKDKPSQYTTITITMFFVMETQALILKSCVASFFYYS